MIEEADKEFVEEQASKVIMDALNHVFNGKIEFDARDQTIVVRLSFIAESQDSNREGKARYYGHEVRQGKGNGLERQSC